MPSSNKTPLGFSQFIETDRFSALFDYNADMQRIDAAIVKMLEEQNNAEQQ